MTLLRKPLAVVLAAAAVVSGVQLASLSPQVQSLDSGIMTMAYSDPGQYAGPTGNVLERTGAHLLRERPSALRGQLPPGQRALQHYDDAARRGGKGNGHG